MSDSDRVTGVALSLSRIYLGCKDAFPTPQMKADWGEIVWREACVTTGTNPESFIPFELVRPIPTGTLRVHHYLFQFAEGNMKLFMETKRRILHIVEAQYGFDTSHAPNSISANAALAQALLSGMGFVYGVRPSSSSPLTNRRPSLRKLDPTGPVITRTDTLHSKGLSTSHGFNERTMTGSFFMNIFLRCQPQPLPLYSQW